MQVDPSPKTCTDEALPRPYGYPHPPNTSPRAIQYWWLDRGWKGKGCCMQTSASLDPPEKPKSPIGFHVKWTSGTRSSFRRMSTF
jgi:hypothetical protein